MFLKMFLKHVTKKIKPTQKSLYLYLVLNGFIWDFTKNAFYKKCPKKTKDIKLFNIFKNDVTGELSGFMQTRNVVSEGNKVKYEVDTNVSYHLDMPKNFTIYRGKF